MEKVHVLLTIVPDDNETYVNLFTTKQGVSDYVKDNIRQMWEEMHWEEDVADEDRNDLYRTQEEAEKALCEKGVWVDPDGVVYRYDEKAFTA